MTLRGRIALVAAAAVAVTVAVTSVVAYGSARRELIQEIDQSLVDRTEQIARFPMLAAFDLQRGRGPGRSPADPFGRGGAGFDALYFQAVDEEGRILLPVGQELVLPTDRVAADLERSEGSPVLRTVEVDGLRLRMITSAVGDDALLLARSLEEADATLADLARAQWLTGIVGMVAAAALGLVVARSSLRPVARLTEAAEHVAATQELEARIEVDRNDEIGRLATSFNAMLSALDDSRAQQHRLVRDASHELRTPLTAVRTNIELLARARDLEEATKTAILADLEAEMAELAVLVDELVQLATDTADDEPLTTGLRLDRVVERAVERYRRRTGRTITLTAAPVRVDGRPGQLERAVGNLLDNAAKWSPEGSAISVEVEGTTVSVVDGGPGIPAPERARVFDRFYRSPGAGEVPGSGLGLAIVEQIVSDHGGEVFVDDAPGGGAVVGFRL
jgi:two-component system sensor histidine kinase MprB